MIKEMFICDKCGQEFPKVGENSDTKRRTITLRLSVGDREDSQYGGDAIHRTYCGLCLQRIGLPEKLTPSRGSITKEEYNETVEDRIITLLEELGFTRGEN